MTVQPRLPPHRPTHIHPSSPPHTRGVVGILQGALECWGRPGRTILYFGYRIPTAAQKRMVGTRLRSLFPTVGCCWTLPQASLPVVFVPATVDHVPTNRSPYTQPRVGAGLVGPRQSGNMRETDHHSPPAAIEWQPGALEMGRSVIPGIGTTVSWAPPSVDRSRILRIPPYIPIP